MYTKGIITYIVFCPLHFSLEMQLRDLTVSGQSPNVIGFHAVPPCWTSEVFFFVYSYTEFYWLFLDFYIYILACCIVLSDHCWEKFVPSCTSHDSVFACTHFFSPLTVKVLSNLFIFANLEDFFKWQASCVLVCISLIYINTCEVEYLSMNFLFMSFALFSNWLVIFFLLIWKSSLCIRVINSQLIFLINFHHMCCGFFLSLPFDFFYFVGF